MISFFMICPGTADEDFSSGTGSLFAKPRVKFFDEDIPQDDLTLVDVQAEARSAKCAQARRRRIRVWNSMVCPL